MTARPDQSDLSNYYQKDGLCRILSLDGGGAKGFYNLLWHLIGSLTPQLPEAMLELAAGNGSSRSTAGREQSMEHLQESCVSDISGALGA
jgi:hypothetical protein